MKQQETTGADACIHCHLCRDRCEFLRKYNIDIGDTERLRELAYSCFLCGKCSEICPLGIDGRKIVLDMRRERVEQQGGKLREKGTGLLLFEKKRYLFKNYRNQTEGSVLFPGCNFPSFYPQTTKYLAGLLRREAGMGTVFDCCGKPLAELGLVAEEERILRELDTRFRDSKIQEIVTLCPNCFHFLKGRLHVKVTGIYEKLRELGLGRQIEEELSVFLPCPDRADRELLGQISHFLDKPPTSCGQGQCCGLGGGASGRERELSDRMAGKLGEGKHLAVYCASCAGSLIRKGYGDTEHILVKILGTGERADTAHSLANRMKFKYWKEDV